jgi:hypothetical protein
VLLIEKECLPTIRMYKLEAAERRVPCNNLKYSEIVLDYKNRLAGYRGEKSLVFHLSMLSESKFHIFHGLRLLYGKYYFQIDTLILTTAFALILEVKNLSGEISFKKELNQTIQKHNGHEKRIKNPVLQARLQAKKLKKWLEDFHFTEIPIHYLFINTNEKAIIRYDSGIEHTTRSICNSEFLLEKIAQIEDNHKNEILDMKELRKIKRTLLTKHTPENPDILHYFNLSQKDTLTGVQCPECRCFSMNYKYGTWCCPKCKHKSKTAHIQAINDYFLLIKPSITNAELRKYLHIDSIKVANKILTSMNLSITGKFKDRAYHPLPFQ